ncbi:MAG: homoserine O-succinyltransferase [Eubacteriaceae bacterium]|nr:homoserine O-succinyltransferase [Eubacteriaceae bacterium]
MPLIIPNELPAAGALLKENIFTMDEGMAVKQDIRPLKIVIVNLMPTKIATETQLARALSNTPLQVELTLVCMDSHEAKHATRAHMESFYKTLDDIKKQKFDGMILTGAPVEKLPFEEVDYWDELEDIFEYAKKNVYSSMFICWGAQAALYYHYGIQKHMLDQKIFGVFQQKVVRPHNPLMRGFDETFYAPHSRHTEVFKKDILEHPELRILAESKASGPHIMSTENGRQIFVLGHQEYDKETLANEYFRDIEEGKSINVPQNYFEDDDPEKDIMFRWRSHASLLFGNWLNYYVYQATPFDIDSMIHNK